VCFAALAVLVTNGGAYVYVAVLALRR
jgi:hypothetical protein